MARHKKRTKQELHFQQTAVTAKIRRQALGLTQKDVAKKAGISKKSYERLEQAKPVGLTTLVAVSKALRLGSGDLIP